MYDVNSKHAEDFINHEEILETLAYANENKCCLLYTSRCV